MRTKACEEMLAVWRYTPQWNSHEYVIAAKTRKEAAGVLERAKRFTPHDNKFVRAKGIWATGNPRMIYL